MQFQTPSTATLQPDFVEKKCPDDLILKGEYSLLQGQLIDAIETFGEIENLVLDSRPDLYYRMAIALFEYGSSDEGREKVLSLSNKKFKKAHLLDPTDTDTLHAWGNLLSHLGEIQDEPHFFDLAKDKYEKIFGLKVESFELFWDHAAVWYHIGCHSEEAVDLQKAQRGFERALEEREENLPAEFWVDYGATALLLSTKVKDLRLIAKAVSCFKRATYQDKNCFDSWSSLSEGLQMLYEHTHDEDHFAQANECFATASKLCPQESEHWLEWAQFLLSSARKNPDLKKLRACLEKCHLAYAYDCENGHILAIWAEALALLGQMTERLDLIYEAENKIVDALEMDEYDPDIWYSLGMCFCSFGEYFNDYDYYYQSIEKFQEGLSLDRSHAPLWLGMAGAYTKVGILEENIETLIQSFKFYEKALTIADTSTHHIAYATALSKLGEFTRNEGWLKQAIWHFETALAMQKNAIYLHPEWLFAYASTLDMLGDFHDDEKYYTKAIEIFSHVLMVDPDFPHLHHRIAHAFCHLGEMLGEIDYFYRAVHHLRLSLKQEEDNDSMILDWGIALIHISQHTPVLTDVSQLMLDAEQKLTRAAKLGNASSYYYLSCLYSLLNQSEKALYFLQKADYFKALPPIEELLSDEWLDHLRSTSAFQEYLASHPHLHKES